MVFCANAAMALALLALAAGTMLMLFAAKQEVCCKGFGKVIGIIIVVISLLLILCNGYHKFAYWKAGEMGCPMMKGGGGMGMMHRKMMEKMSPDEREKMMKMMKEGEEKGE